ncbi:MAG: DUF2341 domain-containing protein, partial [Gemmatimonadaceae bacterium]
MPTYGFSEAAVGGTLFGTLDTVVAPTGTTLATGWTVSTTAASNYSKLDVGVTRAKTTFATAVLPVSPPDATLGDAFRTAAALSGSFAAGNWAFSVPLISSVATGTGALVVRVYRSTSIDGSTGLTEITSAAQSFSTYTDSTAGASTTLTWAAPAIALVGEYLFVQFAYRIITASGTSTATVKFRSGGSVTTTAFTVTVINGTASPSGLNTTSQAGTTTATAAASATNAVDIGINFRGSAAYVTDGANETYALHFDTYPTTRGGVTFGWVTYADFNIDRSTTVPPELAGVGEQPNNGTQANLRIDLPAPGTYDIRLAQGDAVQGQARQYIEVLDGTTSVLVNSNAGNAGGEFYDANNTKWTTATWPTSNTPKRVTFSGTEVHVKLGTPTADINGSDIAHIRFVSVSGTPTGYPARVSTVTAVGAVSATGTRNISVAGHAYKAPVTINHLKVSGAADLSNFPVLVSVALPAAHVTSASGYDIVFTADSAGTVSLDYEIASYNATTGALLAWVRIPTLSVSVDTVIYAFYGNSSVTTATAYPAGVWDPNFIAVYHFGDGATLSAQDSTGNANHGLIGSGVAAAAGPLAGAASFNGTNDIQITDRASLKLLGARTLSASIKPTDFANWNSVLTKGAGGTRSYGLQVRQSTGLPNNGSSTQAGAFRDATGPTAVPTASWTYMHGSYEPVAAGAVLYINGGSVATGSYTGQTDDTISPTCIGSLGGAGDFYRGLIAEVRLSNIVRSSAWIATDYNAQSSPSTFATLGAETTGATVVNGTASPAGVGTLTALGVALAMGAALASPASVGSVSRVGTASATGTTVINGTATPARVSSTSAVSAATATGTVVINGTATATGLATSTAIGTVSASVSVAASPARVSTSSAIGSTSAAGTTVVNGTATASSVGSTSAVGAV